MSGVFEVRRNFSAVIRIVVDCMGYSFEFVIVVKKIDPNFPLFALLLHKKSSSKMIKTLQSLVSLLFVAVPSGAMKLE